MRYRYIIEKSRKYKVTSPDFPSLAGLGATEDDAFNEFLTLVFKELRDCLKNSRPAPDNLMGKSTTERTFGLPFNMILKLRLHNILLNRGVSKSELAKFLSLTYDDVQEDGWNIDNLRTITGKEPPKYKKVQRLFSIDHESTIREVEQAYRVLGYTIDAIPKEKKK